MKNILLIGVGGTGSNAVDMLYSKIASLGQRPDTRIKALVFDTDAGDVEKIETATAIPMVDPGTVGKVCDTIDTDALKEWFDYNNHTIRKQEMYKGAAQWRKKSFLAFINLMNKPQHRATFHNAMDSLFDPNESSVYEIYTIASIAGGTGSGSFIPITLYAKRYIKAHLGKEVMSSAVLACPDIYASLQSEDNRIKVYANAYAILRELNAINLVTHGYNRPNPNAKEQHPNVKFKIGHERSPVGVLFDAEKEEFWKPQAAPFDTVFLLDKIPGVTSVQAHDVVLANSLYTVLCTEIGARIDSELSNHEMLSSQSNGYNAIYAGIATSELHYPTESILEYLAHRQALEASNKEWVFLHKNTESVIKEEQKIAAETRRQYIPERGDYAKKFLISVQQELNTPTTNIDEILRRGSEYTTKGDNNKPIQKKYLDEYLDVLEIEIESRIPNASDVERWANDNVSTTDKIGLFDNRTVKEGKLQDTFDMAENANAELINYYKACLTAIHNNETSLSDAILTFDSHKDINGNEVLSVMGNILTHNGKYVHPVAAMSELCALQTRLLGSDALKGGFERWDDIRNYDKVTRIPDAGFYVDSDAAAGSTKSSQKSAYRRLEQGRLKKMIDTTDYLDSKTSDIQADAAWIRADIIKTVRNIETQAKEQFKAIIYDKICTRLEELIAQYRRFFNSFEEERIGLEEKTEAVLRKDSEIIGSVYNVGSSIENKLYIYEKLNDGAGGPSMEDVINTDNIAGKGVFDIVYSLAQEQFEDGRAGRMESAGFDSLFDGMVNAYKEQIRKNSNYIKLTEKNVFEVIADNCGKRASAADILKAEKKAVQRIIELARPALMIDNYKPDDGTPAPSTVTVMLISTEIATYLKRHAEQFNLTVGYDGSEEAACRACAEQFISNAGAHGVRLAIVDDIPSNVVYVTSEIIDVQPMHIKKIDEMSTDPIYFRNYMVAVSNIDRYETDMWNPHLGFNLHRRGYLPYINPALEKENDIKLMKALLYAIMKGEVVYNQPLRQAPAFRYMMDGIEKQVVDSNNNAVGRKNISALVTWLRPQSERIEVWSKELDAWVESECKQLPQVASEEDLIRLEQRISGCQVIRMLRDNIFYSGAKKGESLSLIEFAYEVKTSEEAENDCDDAEKILHAGYEIFCKYCSYRIPVEKNPGLYAALYVQQVEKIFESLAKGNALKGAEAQAADGQGRQKNPKEVAIKLASWVNSNGCFKTIREDNVVDPSGNIVYKNYSYKEGREAKDSRANGNTEEV